MAKTGLARLLAGRGANDRAAIEDEAARLAAAAKAAEDDDEEDDSDESVEDEEEGAQSTEGEDEEDEGQAEAEASAGGERGRIKAILDAPEAKGRESLARHLALDTDMSSAAAIAVLKASPAGAKGRLAAAMEQAAQPKLGPGGGGSTADETETQAAARLAGYVNAPRPGAAG